jgi:3-oxoacyl-[acyl-carrier protein] reductase
MIDTKLKDKVVIVTGANHGIGAATSIAFAREDAKVFMTYLRLSPSEYGGISEEEAMKATLPGRAYYHKMQAKSADEVVKAIQDQEGKCHAWEADLADPSNIPRIFDRAEEELGKVDILVNNAAWGKCDSFIPPDEINKNPLFIDEFPIQTITANSHDEHFAVNCRAVALMIKEFAQRHISRKAAWGRIINISTDGAPAHPSAISYGASKFATESYTRAAAIELGPYGITVNVISPGAVQTGWINTELEKNLVENYPLRRMGKPEDIANAVIFFASEQADWITGQVIYVGGGNRM